MSQKRWPKHLPIDFLKACVRASVLDISSEKISEPASMVKGVSSPKLLAIPILKHRSRVKTREIDPKASFSLYRHHGRVRGACRLTQSTEVSWWARSKAGDRMVFFTYARAVLPVPGCPPMRMALPAIFPSLIMLRITPAARLASTY